jgi:hypothetical protein
MTYILHHFKTGDVPLTELIFVLRQRWVKAIRISTRHRFGQIGAAWLVTKLFNLHLAAHKHMASLMQYKTTKVSWLGTFPASAKFCPGQKGKDSGDRIGMNRIGHKDSQGSGYMLKWLDDLGTNIRLRATENPKTR